ncbi:MAG: biotin carboxylase [Clostridiales bacterium]|jgi:hypothetical protein|nr:biotin carboxylase [Clostridiales bacterium]
MSINVPKRIATTLMNSLKGGVVPRVGLGYIAVGRDQEVSALLQDVDIIEEGGASFRFIVGKYGSGKSFLLQTIRTHAMDRGFVVIDADLSPERRLMGTKGQGLATYKELIQNMSTKTRPDGGALPLILDKWISQIQAEVIQEKNLTPNDAGFSRCVEMKIFTVINEIEGMVNGFDFAKVISMYWEAYRTGNDEIKSYVLKWLRGEYTTKTEARREMGISAIISDEDWYEYVKLFTLFLVRAGYKGMLMLIDELVNIYKIPNSITRQYNYEKILTLYNDTLQGKAKYLGIIMGGTPQCIEDTRRGVFSYEALRSRLESGRFASEDTRDLLAPIIKLRPLTYEEMFVLVEKLSNIHANLYSYESVLTEEELIAFIKVEFSRIGADTNITPREIIRDFIELLNTLYQYPNKKMIDIIGKEGFNFANSDVSDENIHEEFEEFEL